MSCFLQVIISAHCLQKEIKVIISAVDVYIDQSFIDKAHPQKPIPLLLTNNKTKGIKEKIILMKENTHERFSES